jgi:prepilin-type N-terminal cleavage/methylation domain-containing protein
MNAHNKHFANQRGFTLIELVVTTLVLGVIAYVVAIALSAGMKAYFTTDYREEALDQARVAMERMTREIRNLRDSSPTSVLISTNLEFMFVDTNGNSVDFKYVSPNITRNTNTLSTNVSSCTFGYIRTDGTVDSSFSAANTKRIRISIVSTINTESVRIQSEVWPRIL